MNLRRASPWGRPFLLCLLISVMLPGGAGAQKPFFAISDINRVLDVSDPAPTIDGSALLYTLTANNRARDTRSSDLWRVDLAGGSPRQLTRTPDASEWMPLAVPGGKRIAFLSDRGKDGVAQLWTMDMRGGGARRVTNMPGGIEDYDLSPDGRRAVVVATNAAPPSDDKPQPPIVIDRYRFKEDGRGRLGDERRHLFIVDLSGKGTPRQITGGAFDDAAPSWSPDGSMIAFASMREPDADRTLNWDVYLVPVDGNAKPRRMGDFSGGDSDPGWEAGRPRWSPDGKRLMWLRGGESKWIYYTPFEPVIADVATGAVTTLPKLDRWVYQPRWSPDGKSILALIEEDRSTWLARIDIATGARTWLSEGPRFAFDHAVMRDGTSVLLDGDAARPYELRTVGPSGRALTSHNRWLGGVALSAMRDVEAKGAAAVGGLLMLPPGIAPGERPPAPLPLIIRLHGGPVYQFSREFMGDWQAMAARGYAVVGVNPRGSSGKGFDFSRAIHADWGEDDVADVRAMIDHLVATGIADPKRIGVGGWSYGGILTNYMIAREPRIAAAVSGAGMGNFLSGYGTDQYAAEYELELGAPWAAREVWEKLSYPFFEAGKISAPTLFLCAEADDNVPCLGGEQMYQALASRRVPSRLVIYPGETHSLAVPSYVEDRLTRTIDWYDRYLGASAPVSAPAPRP